MLIRYSAALRSILNINFVQVNVRKSKRRSIPKAFFDDTPKNVKKATSKVPQRKTETSKAKPKESSIKKKGKQTKGDHTLLILFRFNINANVDKYQCFKQSQSVFFEINTKVT